MIGTVPVLGGEHGRSRSTSSRASMRRSAVSSVKSTEREWFDLLDAPSKQWIDLPQSGHRPDWGRSRTAPEYRAPSCPKPADRVVASRSRKANP